MTFTLISVVYACGVAKPGHGSFTPLAVGLSLVACAGTGKGYKRISCSKPATSTVMCSKSTTSSQDCHLCVLVNLDYHHDG